MKDVNLLIGNGVDVNSSLELFGDMDAYNETLEQFLEGVNEKLSQIKKYKEAGDMKNYSILVHSLKSDARYLGFTELARLSYEHELASKDNNINEVYEKYNDLMYEAKRIIDLTEEYLGASVSVPVAEEETKVSEVKDKTILVVDDSDLIRTFIKRIFNDSYQVLIAHDGEEAIKIIENSNIDNIIGMLLDLNMPNVDGFAVLDYLKQHNLFDEIPVSIITGADSKDNIERAFTYPIIDVLSKPFNEVNIKRIIEKAIYMKR
jgi:CheY-like chemotaxis protein